MLKSVLLSAISLHYICKNVSSCSKTAVVNKTLLPFMDSLLGDLFGNQTGSVDNDMIKHEKRLDDVLKSWNFKKQIVPSDGDCLFRLVALHLAQHGRHNQALLATLAKLNIVVDTLSNLMLLFNLHTCIVDIIHVLCCGFVDLLPVLKLNQLALTSCYSGDPDAKKRYIFW